MEPAPFAESLSVRPTSKYKTLDHLLDDYKQSGVDSEGHFTLNPVRARELLKQFQLPEPSHYLLHLVSFMVGAGAKGVSISSSRSSLRVEAPGASVKEETVKSPFSVLLQSNANPHLSELALALNTLLGQSGGRAELTFGTWKARYNSKKIDVAEVTPSDLLTVVVSPRLGSKDRELELVREAFFWCPVPVKINGQTIHQPDLSSQLDGLEIHLKNEKYPLLQSPYTGNRLVKVTKANFSASLRILRGKAGLRVLHLGRAYRKPLPWSFFVPGWQVDVTVNSDQFKKDLSQQDILENEKYQNLLSALRVQLDLATDTLLAQAPPFTGSEALVDDTVEQLFVKGQPKVASDYQGRLVHALSLTTQSFEKGRAIYRFGLLENAVTGRTASPHVKLGFDMLKANTDRRPLEPRWTVLKAQMAFTPRAPKLNHQVKEFLQRRDLPSYVIEHCYRWLLRLGQEGPRVRVGYIVELARQAYETGRLDEAQAQIDALKTGHEAQELQSNKDYALAMAELEGELAAQSGQAERSLEMFGRQLALLREKHGQYSLKLGVTLKRLALLLEHLGKNKQAKEYLAWSQRLYE